MSFKRVNLVIGLFVAAAAGGLPGGPVDAGDPQKVVICPPGKTYCTEETRSVVSGADAAHPDQPAARQTVGFDPDQEAQKARTRASTGYRDPGQVSLCAPPHRMTGNGCQ